MRIIFLLIVVSGFANIEFAQKPETDQVKIDSVFIRSFDLLELYLKDKDSDPSLRRVESIHFLEAISGIAATSDGNRKLP